MAWTDNHYYVFFIVFIYEIHSVEYIFGSQMSFTKILSVCLTHLYLWHLHGSYQVSFTLFIYEIHNVECIISIHTSCTNIYQSGFARFYLRHWHGSAFYIPHTGSAFYIVPQYRFLSTAHLGGCRSSSSLPLVLIVFRLCKTQRIFPALTL